MSPTAAAVPPTDAVTEPRPRPDLPADASSPSRPASTDDVAADGTGATTDAGALADAGDEAPVRAPRLSTVGAALATVLGALVGIVPLYDNSFLTHLATGRLILDRGSVPATDPYSFTAAGDPWVVQSWFASVVYAATESLAGLDGIRILQGVLCALLGLATWVLTSRNPSLVVRGAVTGAVLLAGAELWTGRPLLFGLLGLAVVLLVADGHLDARVLVPVGWVWVNTHGSFPYALLALGLLAVGTRLDTGAWGREVRAGGWAVLGIGLGALNPIGPRLLTFPLTVTDRAESFRAVEEWQPPRGETIGQLVVFGLLALTALGLVRTRRWRDVLPAVAFGALALTAARNGAVVVLVLAPILASVLPPVGVDASERRAIARPALVAVLVLGLVVSVASLARPATDLGRYPTDAVAWMEAEGLWGPDARVLSTDRVGNYRTFVAGEDARVFVDDRVDMYPVAVVADYRHLARADAGWQELMAERGITAVLWPADSPLGRALATDDGWTVVHRDSLWVVAVPDSSL